jgi:amidophosphoribosyltransferase
VNGVNEPRYYHDDHFHDQCGVFAVYGHPEAAKLTYLGLYALQHRGQESAGIVATDGREMRDHKGMGEVAEVFTEPVMGTLVGHAAIGHTRYSTAGDTSMVNAQPLVVGCNKGQLALAHNGNLVNARQVRRRLEGNGSIFQTTSDSEVIVHLLAQSDKSSFGEAFPEALRKVEGAYSLVTLTREAIYAMRDPRGFRPLCLGKLDGAWVVGSETCAFDLIGAEYIREIEPGEMVVLSRNGVESSYFSPPVKHSYCIFEHVYFSRPDSVIFGRPVQKSREMLGRLLSREHPAEADLVVPVPDSGTAAAIGYSQESGLPLKVALIRNHYIGRTFIQPEQTIRDFNVKVKLNPIRSVLENKNIILVDDSIVRGTTMRKIVRMIRGAGAQSVHVRISCPPIISPCFYGIDTPTKRELIGSHKTVDKIRDFIEADSLGYLSLDNLRKAVADAEGRYCRACYTGDYPTDFVELRLKEEDSVPAKRSAKKKQQPAFHGKRGMKD